MYNIQGFYKIKSIVNCSIHKEKMKAYLEGSVKQITLIFSNEEFERTISRMEKAGQELKAESNTEVLLKLLDHYESQ